MTGIFFFFLNLESCFTSKLVFDIGVTLHDSRSESFTFWQLQLVTRRTVPRNTVLQPNTPQLLTVYTTEKQLFHAVNRNVVTNRND